MPDFPNDCTTPHHLSPLTLVRPANLHCMPAPVVPWEDESGPLRVWKLLWRWMCCVWLSLRNLVLCSGACSKGFSVCSALHHLCHTTTSWVTFSRSYEKWILRILPLSCTAINIWKIAFWVSLLLSSALVLQESYPIQHLILLLHPTSLFSGY